MSTKAANLEASIIDLAGAGLPAVGSWSARLGQGQSGFSVKGGSKLTLTNVSGVEVTLSRDETPIGNLGGRDLVTINLDPKALQLVTLDQKAGDEAEGFFVLHGSRFDWQLSGPEVEHQTGFAGATTLALVNHPRSGFTVQLIAGGGAKVRVEPGKALIAGLNAEEARSVVIRRFGEAAGGATAQGTICLAADGAA